MESKVVKVLGKRRGPSLGAATNFWIDGLTAHAKALLCLTYSCKARAVPEDVLRLMYTTIRPPNSFSKAVEELFTKEVLVTCAVKSPRTDAFDWSSEDEAEYTAGVWPHSYSLYLNSDMKVSIGWQMANSKEIEFLLYAVLEDMVPALRAGNQPRDTVMTEEIRMAVTLCALYFDENHPQVVVQDAIREAKRTTFAPDLTSDLLRYQASSSRTGFQRRQAIRPILWLAARPPLDDGQWTKADISSAGQVFLRYIGEHDLDGANISALLRCARYTSAPVATLTAICSIFSLEENPIRLDKSNLSFLEVLVDLLKSDKCLPDESMQKAASDALFQISAFSLSVENDQLVAAVVVSTPGLLAVLVRLLLDMWSNTRPSISVAKNAVRTLFKLSCCVDDSVKLRILNEDGAIACLKKALDLHSNDLSKDAARTLASLAQGASPLKLKLLRGAAVGLVRTLSSGKFLPTLKDDVATVLLELAQGGPSVRIEILKTDGVISALVAASVDINAPSLPGKAVRILNLLAYGGDSIKLQISKQALGCLLTFLEADHNPSLQEEAAKTLRTLSKGGEPVKLEILEKDGVLAALVGSLTKDSNPQLQEDAVATLLNVAGGGSTYMKRRVAGEDGAIAALVRCLDVRYEHPQLQEDACLVLISIADEEESLKLQILKEVKALSSLIECLFQSTNRTLQCHAAHAIWALAEGGESIKCQMLKDEYALEDLLAKSNDTNKQIRWYVHQALKSLRSAEGWSMKLNFINEKWYRM